MHHHFPRATTPWVGKAFQRLPRQHGSSDGNGRGAVKEPRALQHRLRHQLREAEAEAAVSQDWALSMLAAELAADQRCALQQRLRHQLMGLTMLPVEAEGRELYAVTHRQRGQTKEGAAEAEERHNSV